MTEALYLKDSYLKEWNAIVQEVDNDTFIVLDKTAFYPNGGGQPYDEGLITKEDGTIFKVRYCGKFNGYISHEVNEPGLKPGDEVFCRLDWNRRYRLMKMHTAIHILSEVIHRDTNAMITGGQLGEEKSRMDFALEEYDRDKIMSYIDFANKKIQANLPITIEFLPREEAEKIPIMTKLAKGLSKEIKEIRIVNIGDFDIQADGGTHVKNTNEIGTIKLLKIDNRGRNNRRIYFTLE
ncbi:alanyl-tRNA editing protein [Candidatus Pacearchaeota archaeon]|nr:alanyl-tRNA editing protein [Candidatus Pacearchaeota archaeon]